MEFHIVEFTKDFEKKWDLFVQNESVNGTFLQTRRFLNYHPFGRFTDASLLVLDEKNTIAAVCPGCITHECNKNIFVSHQGSTFGGIIVREKYYLAKYLLKILNVLNEYFLIQKYNQVILKITPDLFCSEPSDLLKYCLQYYGYKNYIELSTYIDLEKFKENTVSNFSQGKRTNVNNCLKKGLVFRKIEKDFEVKIFHEILCENLSKFNALPVHTLEELLEFKNHRLTDECEFYGVFLNEEMLAGGMVFNFKKIDVVHTQYLCAKKDYNKLSPMTFLYYSIIEEMKNKKINKISWGISTENQGKELNIGLISSKESYGSKHSLNQTFYKCF